MNDREMLIELLAERLAGTPSGAWAEMSPFQREKYRRRVTDAYDADDMYENRPERVDGGW